MPGGASWTKAAKWKVPTGRSCNVERELLLVKVDAVLRLQMEHASTS